MSSGRLRLLLTACFFLLLLAATETRTRNTQGDGMNAEKLNKYRERLVDMAARLKQVETSVSTEALRQAGGDASGNLSNVPMHMADLSTDTFEQEMSTCLLKNERQLQIEVAAALDRLEQGRFGRCERCNSEISEGRLQALPYTRYCLGCAQGAEEDGEVGFQPTLVM